jgi:glycosyltransferase involved in cell wall biosynthesis
MKFSVVVCTYNYAHLLPDTLRSIAAQTARNFELLIVDDGSTDNTEEIAEKFRPQFQDFRYLKKSHTGPADSRNAGATAAQGSHIAFLDADDLWSVHYLSAMQETFSANPQAELALCEGIIFRSENGVVTEAALHRRLPALCGPVRSPDELFGVIQAFTPSGMVFSRALFERTGPFDADSFASYSEDIDWMFRALMAGTFCACVNRRLYLYRRHDENLTNKAGESFRAWLTTYTKTLREGRDNPRVEALARGVIRARAARFLTTCSTRQGKILLRQALETLGGDAWVSVCYLGCFLGLVSLLKFLKRAKLLLLRLFRKKLLINLGSSRDAVFDLFQK